MKTVTHAYKPRLSARTLRNEITEKLAYFGVFNHPLRAEEIQNVLHNYYALTHVNAALAEMTTLNLCFENNGYYSMHKGVADEARLRMAKEQNALYFYKKLPVYARLIAAFPYVRGVAVSGSLSKGVIHEEGDIDYFIITAHNRLWVTRMMLILFKKIALFNSRRFFCVNYFVSEKHLEIPDKNLFTATEIVTLLPVYNPQAVAAFRAANPWVKMHYGHFEQPIAIAAQNIRFGFLKHFGEWVLNTKIGDWLDVLSMHITVWRWHVKFKTFSRSKFDLALRSTRHVSKHHPRDFQSVVLDRVAQNRDKINNRLPSAP